LKTKYHFSIPRRIFLTIKQFRNKIPISIRKIAIYSVDLTASGGCTAREPFTAKLGFPEEIDRAAVANVLQRQTTPAHSPPGSKSFKKKVLRWDPLMKQNLRFGLVRPGQVNSFPDLCTFWFQEKLRSTKYALVGL
jgi:hypothetical protein